MCTTHRTVATGVQIQKVERVQNIPLWESYAAQRKVLAKTYQRGLDSGALRVSHRSPGDGEPIERALWHGTKTMNNYELTSTAQGWCASYAHRGSCGKGIYFAPSPGYSMGGYAHRCEKTGHSQLILADVLIGASSLALASSSYRVRS